MSDRMIYVVMGSRLTTALPVEAYESKEQAETQAGILAVNETDSEVKYYVEEIVLY